MEGLLVKIDAKKHLIVTNFDVIKAELAEKMSVYKGVIVDEDTIKESKKDVADLRKLRDEIETKRKEIKKEWEQPYNDFKARCDELLKLIDEPIEEINTQVKAFDEQKKTEKKKVVEAIYAETIGEYAEYLPFDSVFDPKWLNVATSKKDIKFDLSEKIVKVRSDLDIIHGLGSEIESELIDIYKRNGNNLVSAMQRNQQYVTDKMRIQSAAAQPTMSEQPKVESEKMKSLNDMIEKTKTAKIIVSKEDLQLACNALDFNDIKYQIIED